MVAVKEISKIKLHTVLLFFFPTEKAYYLSEVA